MLCSRIIDRHAVEQMLSDYRGSILVGTKWNNFFCGLHYLVGLADSAEATLKIWESTIEENNNLETRRGYSD